MPVSSRVAISLGIFGIVLSLWLFWIIIAVIIPPLHTPFDIIEDGPHALTYTERKIPTTDPYGVGSYYPFDVPKPHEIDSTTIAVEVSRYNHVPLKRLIETQAIHTHGRLLYAPKQRINSSEYVSTTRVYVHDSTYNKIMQLVDIAPDGNKALQSWGKSVPRHPVEYADAPTRTLEVKIITNNPWGRLRKEAAIAFGLTVLCAVTIFIIDRFQYAHTKKKQIALG